jgi:hypothetical protein
MDDLIDMIVSDGSPSDVSDRIKEILFSKSSERVDAVRPHIASDMFDETNQDEDIDQDTFEDQE